jgi:hypothetical protein
VVPSSAVAWYELIGEPFARGACQETVAWASPETAVTPAGASGTPSTVNGPAGADAEPGPTAFVAVTVTV